MGSNGNGKPIRLSCEYGGMPGFCWAAEVTFRRLRRGFSVWQVLSDGGGAPGARRVKVGDSKDPLTWRRAIEWLRSRKIEGLSGTELAPLVVVEGVSDVWASELCAVAWVQFENALEPLLDHLLAVPDEEIALYRQLLGEFTDEAAVQLLSELEDALAPKSLGAGAIRGVLDDLRWAPGMQWDELVERAVQLGEAYSLAQASGFELDCIAGIAAAAGFQHTPPLETLLGRLEETAADVAAVEQAGRDRQLRDFFLERGDREIWSKEVMEQGYQIGGRIPARFARQALLTWTGLPEKPLGPRDGSFASPALSILDWILDAFDEEQLNELARDCPAEVRSIREWIRLRIEEQGQRLNGVRQLRAGPFTGVLQERSRREAREKLRELERVYLRLPRSRVVARHKES